LISLFDLTIIGAFRAVLEFLKEAEED